MACEGAVTEKHVVDRAERAMSTLAFVAATLPLILIVLWKDWKFTRSRFILVICTTSFLST